MNDTSKEEEEEESLVEEKRAGMEVFYVVISRRDVVLCEYTSKSGNFEQVSRILLRRINQDGKAKNCLAQLRYDDYVFHYSILEGITYMCMTEQTAGNRRPFAFLTNVSDTFIQMYGARAHDAIAYEFNKDFCPILRQKVEYFLTNIEADAFGSLRQKIDDAKDIMVSNIEQLLDRGERIDLLVNKSEQLNTQAFHFKKQTTKLKQSMCCKRIKFYLFCFFVLALLGGFIAILVCAPNISSFAHKSS